MRDAVRLDGAQGFIEKRAAQVPVVVTLCVLFSGFRVCGTNHTKILAIGVDSVNILSYLDVDNVHIELAFDLLVGTSELEDAAARGIPHWMVVPCLLLTFLFGPAGWLLYTIVRSIRRTVSE